MEQPIKWEKFRTNRLSVDVFLHPNQAEANRILFVVLSVLEEKLNTSFQKWGLD